MGLECRWPGCTAKIKPDEWACKPHMARIPSDLRKILLEVFDWKSMVMDGNEPSQDYVAVSEAVREAAHDYNNRWSIFEGYNGGDGVTAVDIQKPPPPRRRRRKKHA